MRLLRKSVAAVEILFKPVIEVRALHMSRIRSDKMKIMCTLIPGDGVGPELADSVLTVFKAASIPLEFHKYPLSEINPSNSSSLEDVVKSVSKNGICLKGVLAYPDESKTGELASLNIKLRNALDLYANVVHVETLPGVNTRHNSINLTVIREQTEGEYSALEHESVPGVVECLKIITSAKCERIAKFAFDYATRNHRNKVTAIHKANIMKLGDGLFLQSCKDISKLYPKIKFESMIVDNCTMQLVSNPQQFDVMVTPNLYGNILDNLSAGLVGGAGVVAGASYSADCAVFEPGAKHGFLTAAGKDVANPTAMLLSSAKMLSHVNLKRYADVVKKAVKKVLEEGKVRTKDLGGQATTRQFTDAVVNNLS